MTFLDWVATLGPDKWNVSVKEAWEAGYAEGIAQRQNHTDWLIKHIKFLEKQIREKNNG